MRNHVDVWVMAFADTSEATIARVADVFAIDAEVAARLVSSTPKMVKRDVPPSSALKFRRALLDLGAEMRVVSTGTDPTLAEKPRLPSVDPPPMPEVDAPPPAPPERRAVDLPPPPREGGVSAKTVIAVAASLAGVLLIGAIAWFLSGGEEAELADDIDSVCERELAADDGHAEAREWLGDPHHAMLGLADPRSAPGLVSSLYDAGATEVRVTQIHGTRLQSSAGVIVATFSPGSGDSVRAAAETGLGLTGDMVAIAIDPHVDLGERYLRITLAPAHAADGEANAWEQERRERERIEAEGRGFGADME